MDYTAIRRAVVREEGLHIDMFFPTEETDAFVVLFRGFPPGDAATKYHPIIQNLVHRGLCVVVPTYLGINNSDGEFSYTASKLAADVSVRMLERGSAIDELSEEELTWKLSRMWFIGTSFGGTIALCAAPKYQLEGVLAVSPVTDWNLPVNETNAEMTAYMQRVMPHSVRLAIHWFDSDPIQPRATDLHRTKVLLVHAKQDPVVPFMHSKVMAARLSCPLYEVEEEDHLGLSDISDTYLDALLSSE